MVAFVDFFNATSNPQNGQKHSNLFGLIGFLGSSITRFHNFCDTFIANFLSPIGLGLKITIKYFYGDARVITWVKNSLGKLDNELHVKVKKCVKKKHACVFFFLNQ